MIPTRSQYKFVTGTDIDKIIIGSDIMPRRSGIYQRHLRGEDVCFLIESAAERRQAAWLCYRDSVDQYYVDPQNTHDFVKTISASQIEFVRTIIRGCFTRSGGSIWVKNSDSIPVLSELTSWDPVLQFPDAFYTIEDADPDDTEITVGDPVELAPIMARFVDMRKLKAFFAPGDCKIVINRAQGKNGVIAWPETSPSSGEREQHYAGAIDFISDPNKNRSWCKREFFGMMFTGNITAYNSDNTMYATHNFWYFNGAYGSSGTEFSEFLRTRFGIPSDKLLVVEIDTFAYKHYRLTSHTQY